MIKESIIIKTPMVWAIKGVNNMKEYQRFTAENYFETEGEVKRYLTDFICQADYTDELNFYKSLDVLTNQYFEEDKNKAEDLKTAREYILKMGMPEAMKVLLVISRK